MGGFGIRGSADMAEAAYIGSAAAVLYDVAPLSTYPDLADHASDQPKGHPIKFLLNSVGSILCTPKIAEEVFATALNGTSADDPSAPSIIIKSFQAAASLKVQHEITEVQEKHNLAQLLAQRQGFHLSRSSEPDLHHDARLRSAAGTKSMFYLTDCNSAQCHSRYPQR